MNLESFNFRLAREILAYRPGWLELERELSEISMHEIVTAQAALVVERRSPPAGAQTSINRVVRERLIAKGWTAEPRLFQTSGVDLAKWKMDFIKDNIGVEISFNHAEAIPWTFTRLNVAGESEQVQSGARIDVGVAVFATARLKAWGRMDPAVGTFERATTWLSVMRPIMPIPVLVVGLSDEGFQPVSIFRGTRSGGRGSARTITDA